MNPTAADRPFRDRAAGSVLLCAGLAAGAEATTFDVAFLTDPVGPKALPALVALVLIGSGISMIVRPRDDVSLPDRTLALRMGLAMSAFLIYALVLPWLGFFASTSAVVAALGVLFRGPRLGSVVAGLALSSLLWLLFVRLLSLPLPIGDVWIL